MAWHKQHKVNSKDKILASAAALFTRHGFEKVSINQVMASAKMTRGAFYSHFESKSDLYAQAIIKAAVLAKQQQLEQCSDDLRTMSLTYLSAEHRDEKLENLCPLAFLVTDINQQDEVVKNTYTKIFKGFIEQTQSLTQSKSAALQSAALLIGGLALAKAINDHALSDDLLIACQTGVTELTVRND